MFTVTSLWIPFTVTAGKKAQETQDIQNVIAYYRFAKNRADDFALHRILTAKSRGLGPTKMTKVSDEARARRHCRAHTDRSHRVRGGADYGRERRGRCHPFEHRFCQPCFYQHCFHQCQLELEPGQRCASAAQTRS